MHNIKLPLIYINACSLNNNFDGLEHFLSCTNNSFDKATMTELKITNQLS